MATVTLKKAIDAIEYTLGGTIPGAIDPIGLVNRAGAYLYGMHQWLWTEKFVALTLVADQAYVAFPADFQALSAIENPIRDFEGNGVELTTIQVLHDFRQGALAPPVQQFHGAILAVHPAAGGEVTYRLELWPTPGASPGTLDIYYRLKWIDLDLDEDIATIDPDCVELYLEILRLFARGTVEEDQGHLHQRLASLKASELFEAARDVDATRQPQFGAIHNSMTDVAGRRYAEFRSGFVNDPV